MMSRVCPSLVALALVGLPVVGVAEGHSARPPAARDRDAAKAAAAHRVAATANTLGMQRYRAGDLERAALQFRVAVELDPTYVNAHYNLACVASRLGDPETALVELRWLKASTDPVARQKLAKAEIDPDLDFVSSLPEVRVLLDAAPFDPEHERAWLAERNGVWSTEASAPDCARREYSLTFRGDGQLSLKVHEQCGKRPPIDETFNGTLDGDRVKIADWSAWPGSVALELGSCPRVDAPGSCFTLSTGERQLGPFHRGAPSGNARPHVSTRE
jgi:hypothetical protein